MLKTLEEPPEYIKFVLATTDPQKMPVTVLSRCLQFNLRQMPRGGDRGAPRAGAAGGGDRGRARGAALLARAARAACAMRSSLLDQAIAHRRRQRRRGAACARCSARSTAATAATLLDALAAAGRRRRARRSPTTCRRAACRSRARCRSWPRCCIGWRSRRRCPMRCRRTTPERERDRSCSPRSLDPEDVQLYYQIALHGREDLPLAPDEYAGFTMALLRMLAFAPVEPGAVARPEPAPSVARTEAETTAPARGVQAGARFDGDWPAVARALRAGRRGEAARRAQRARRVRSGRDRAHDGAEVHARWRTRPIVDKLRAALAAHFGRPLALAVKRRGGERPQRGGDRRRRAPGARGGERADGGRSVRAGAGRRLRRDVSSSIKPVGERTRHDERTARPG